MTIEVRGADALKAMLADLPNRLQHNVLRGAMRAMAKVVADEARANVRSDEVRSSIKSGSTERDGQVVAYVRTQGRGAYIAPWLEFGTDPHPISVHYRSRGGQAVTRRSDKKSLKIGDRFVGADVAHPGAQAFPFLRPALDNRMAEAIETASEHVKTRLTREGLMSPAPADESDDE